MKTAVEWLINQLQEQIRKSAHNELGTTRTGEYRIGLRKAIDFCEQAKQMEKQQLGDCWDAALGAYERRSGVWVRASEDFDEYFENRFE